MASFLQAGTGVAAAMMAIRDAATSAAPSPSVVTVGFSTGEPKRLLDESPMLQVASELQRF
eukprot:COSAG01_NODE_32534_length_579_cov_1.437500_1_plen_60_part_10